MSQANRHRPMTFLAILLSASLAACGRTTDNGAPPQLDGATGIDAFSEAPEAGEQDAGANAKGDADAAGGDADTAASDAGTAGEAGMGDAQGTLVEPYFRAGSRLKPAVIRAGDLEVIDGDLEAEWHDTKTGDACVFRVGADGIERCLPAYILEEDTESNPLSYLDPACSRPAVGDNFSRCPGRPHYVTLEPSSSCNYRVYRLGAALPSNTPLYQKSGNSCRRVPALSGAPPLLSLEEEVPPETFVAVKRVSRPRHPRMNAWVREGEDGSSEVVGFSDPARDAPCFGLGLDVSPQLCVPAALQTWDYFSDATCMQQVPIGSSDGPRCMGGTNSALVKMKTETATCGVARSISGIWQIGPLNSAPLFDNSTGPCQLREAGPSLGYTQGAPIDLASLPKLDVIEVGNATLKLAFFGFDGVPFLPARRRMDAGALPGPFIDVARAEPCQPRIFDDGTWRCVPSSFQSVMDFNFYYESENCTGARAYLPETYCWGPIRNPHGIIVQSLSPSTCTRDYLVTETLQVEEGPSETRVSHHGLSQTCTNYPSATLNLLRVSQTLNPADLFIPIERIVKD